MRIALIVLAVVAVALVLVGAFNADVRVGVDLLAGSVDVSLFWLAVGVAGLIALAGVAGWTLGRVEGVGRRRKLERELESTFRRLRESEARSPRPPEPLAPVTVVSRGPAEAVTAAQPAEAVTAAQPAEAVTVEQPAEAVTVEQPAEAVTVERPAEPVPGEPATDERPVPGEQAPGD